MTLNKTMINYWFTIEPYVYVGLTNKCALLYNTLDGVTIESDKIEVVELLQEILQKKNCGVTLLTNERYKNKDINAFIRELREKYMGDIIDVALSKEKPVQLFPYFNSQYSNKLEVYKIQNFSIDSRALDNLYEICMHVDYTTDVAKLISFLQSIPEGITFNIIGNVGEVANYRELLAYFDQYPSPKNIISSYTNIIVLQPTFGNNFSYRVSVRFPINMSQWKSSWQLLRSQVLPFEYIFEVTSVIDCQQVEFLINEFQIKNYQLKPLYTGNNIQFFKENIYLSKEDILNTSLSIKDFFLHQTINIYDFGVIHIMPNGDAYANVSHPVLGNIYMNSINEIVCKEINEGISWFRIRTQAPCNDCVYQWLCPSPSDYEIAIDCPNLCNVNN